MCCETLRMQQQAKTAFPISSVEASHICRFLLSEVRA
ncbi:MAG: hypothetical protein N838_05225 [Thiohalocapsa sp. PB-PSB1]|nr:MAG: hypothetical protein N838_05225 [Thiohalocapsa sp. PB-PSB1]